MVNRFFRRLQRFTKVIKITSLIVCFVGLGYLLIKVPPGLESIVVFSLLLLILVATITSFFLSQVATLLIAAAVAFLFFLRVVSLLTIVNLILLALFIALLGLYLRKK